MRAFRFLHTADVHLGSPMAGWTRDLPEAWQTRLRRAADGVWQRIVDIAIAEQVDFVTIAGDLYDRTDVSMAVHFEWLRGFERLAEAGIPVVLCHGNHDPLTAPPPLSWPASVHVLPAAPRLADATYQAPSVWIDLDDDTRVQVSGFSYPVRELTPSMAYAFVRQPEADFAVALYHGAVGPSYGHAEYCAATEAELVQRGFDVWALGHIHQPTVLRSARPYIAYPGNPQGRHMQETGERGCLVIDVSSSAQVAARFVSTSELIWTECRVRVEEADDLAGVRERVLASLARLLVRFPERWLMVRVVVEGESVSEGLLRLEDDEFLQALRQEASARLWPIWIAHVDWRVRPALDLATLAESPELLGELVRVYQHYQSDPLARREWARRELADVFHPGNGLAFDAISETELAELLQAAFRLLTAWAVQEDAR
ncbi:metallophosphoesterase family protein [Alicyclobacillus herbarius]|uniref:metallophosphoesterase family protein n=1 Tax=Alicyclobacillus herbarius TaxID=122960 RepID=UPI0004002989|nr:DNA repair exonuclease [Alicyclobacillus herbarius]